MIEKAKGIDPLSQPPQAEPLPKKGPPEKMFFIQPGGGGVQISSQLKEQIACIESLAGFLTKGQAGALKSLSLASSESFFVVRFRDMNDEFHEVSVASFPEGLQKKVSEAFSYLVGASPSAPTFLPEDLASPKPKPPAPPSPSPAPSSSSSAPPSPSPAPPSPSPAPSSSSSAQVPSLGRRAFSYVASGVKGTPKFLLWTLPWWVYEKASKKKPAPGSAPVVPGPAPVVPVPLRGRRKSAPGP